MFLCTATSFTQTQTAIAQPAYTSILPDSGVREHGFGLDLAFHGETLLISSVGDSRDGSYSGAVEVYEEADGQWQRIQTLRPSLPANGLGFGRSFKLLEDELIVWSSKAIYIFKNENNTWFESQRLAKPDTLNMGTALTADVSHLFFTTGTASVPVFPEGIVVEYVKSDTSWLFKQILQPNPGIDDALGEDLLICNGMLVAGAPRDPIIGEHSGSVYTWTLNSPADSLFQKIVPADAEFADQFGRVLGCHQDKLIIHSYSRGKTYIYKLQGNQWVFDNFIEVPGNNRFLGPIRSIANTLFINGNAFETNPFNEDQEISSLYAYQYVNDSWEMISNMNIGHILEPWESEDGSFGYAIAQNDKYLAVSAPFRDKMYERASGEIDLLDEYGEVFIFNLNVAVSTEKPDIHSNSPDTFILYPNATAGVSTLTRTSPAKHPSDVTVYDLMGRARLSQQLSRSTSIDLTSLSSGLYFVRVCDEDACTVKSLHKL